MSAVIRDSAVPAEPAGRVDAGNTIQFTNPGTFKASYAAEKWLKDRGFSIGSSQAGAPRAIWHGDCYISKWRGLSEKDMATMDARMDESGREGPVRITLLPSASDEARAAFLLPELELNVPRVRGKHDNRSTP